MRSLALSLPFFLGSAFAEPVDWSQYNDSVMLEIKRPAGHAQGNTICTGVIAAPETVLTTAHCVDGATEIRIVFDVEKGASAKKTAVIKAGSWKAHPAYHREKSLFDHDLAKIRLLKPAPIDPALIRRIPDSIRIPSGKKLVRIGVGLRNGINSRNFTDPRHLSITGRTVLETEDSFSASGDSGGPVYTRSLELIGIHSTRDDRNHKEPERGYGPYLPAYKDWIFSK
jgi:secreted trypsin-like serine protease